MSHISFVVCVKAKGINFTQDANLLAKCAIATDTHCMKPLLPARTPMAFARSIVRAYAKYGMNPRSALQQAHLSHARLAHNEDRITSYQMEVLTKVAMLELDDEALGWYHRKMPYGCNAMLCRASLSSANLGVAIKRWCNHLSIVVEDIEMSLSVVGTEACLSIEERMALGELREFCLVSNLRNIQGYVCWLIDSNIPLIRADFSFPRPAHDDAYDLIFRCPLRFDAKRTRIYFDARYLTHPVRRDDKALRVMLRRPLPLVVLQYRHDRLMSRRIQDLLRSSPQTLGTAAAIADQLGISVRALHRRLAAEGTSLQTVKDEVRKQMAIDLLRRSDKSIKHISWLVGFRNDASFIRAFRKWTGTCPTEYRK